MRPLAEERVAQDRILARNIYNTSRSLYEYAHNLGSNGAFPMTADRSVPYWSADRVRHDSTVMAALRGLTTGSSWLDVGAGEATTMRALASVYGPERPLLVGVTAALPDATRHALAHPMGTWRAAEPIANDRKRFEAPATYLLSDGVRLLSGMRLGDIPRSWLGRFDVVTDVFGAVTYDEDLRGALLRCVQHTKVGGLLGICVPYAYACQMPARPEGKDAERLQLELRDANGNFVHPLDWLARAKGLEVVESAYSNEGNTNIYIGLRRTAAKVELPRLELVEFTSGRPPVRRYRVVDDAP